MDTKQNNEQWLNNLLDDYVVASEAFIADDKGLPDYVATSEYRVRRKNEIKQALLAELQRRETETINQNKLIQKQLSKLDAGLFAVKPMLDKPYSDDPRWTPWTRFVEPRLRMLSQAVFNNKEIGELAAMGDNYGEAQLQSSTQPQEAK